MKIILNWEANASGEDVLDLEDYDITPEEWGEMSEEEKLEVLQEYTNKNYDAVAYGIVTKFNELD